MPHVALIPLYAAVIFLSAFLLFMVQPLTGKMLLPVLGGVPSVWNTCMVFFQFTLLLGYLYAHALSKLQSKKLQLGIHLVVLLLPCAVLPISPPALSLFGVTPAHEPMGWLVVGLGAMAMLPFFALSTTSPLLQRWFSFTDHPQASSPYFLYAASNTGSMMALLAYPLVMEPLASVGTLSWGWALGFGVVACGVVACGVVTTRRGAQRGEAAGAPGSIGAQDVVDWTRRVRWVWWAFVPSSLLLGVTTFITSDVAAAPLLWVIPLALYLGTFILVFKKNPSLLGASSSRLVCAIAIFTVFTIMTGTLEPMWLILPCHGVALFGAVWIAHGRLATDAPGAGHLTEFFFWMSLGGVLGGAFNTFVAPQIFTGIWEYPLMLAIACTLRVPDAGTRRAGLGRDLLFVVGVLALLVSSWLVVRFVFHLATSQAARALMYVVPLFLCYHALEHRRRFGIALLGMVLLGGPVYQLIPPHDLHTSRSFFGILRVMDTPSGKFRVFAHGSTRHGGQELADRDSVCAPSQYYYPGGPAGDLMRATSGAKRVGVVGLGVGTLACYATASQEWVFFEIDPEVVAIAKDPHLFTFLSLSKAKEVTHVLGDGRLSLSTMEGEPFDLLVLDGFSGDSIPMHLMTREAMAIYFSRLTPKGVLAIHISNRFLDLGGVIASLGHALGLKVRKKRDVEPSQEALEHGARPSDWMILVRSPEDLAAFTREQGWEEVEPSPDKEPWSDAYQSLWDAL